MELKDALHETEHGGEQPGGAVKPLPPGFRLGKTNRPSL